MVVHRLLNEFLGCFALVVSVSARTIDFRRPFHRLALRAAVLLEVVAHEQAGCHNLLGFCTRHFFSSSFGSTAGNPQRHGRHWGKTFLFNNEHISFGSQIGCRKRPGESWWDDPELPGCDLPGWDAETLLRWLSFCLIAFRGQRKSEKTQSAMSFLDVYKSRKARTETGLERIWSKSEPHHRLHPSAVHICALRSR